jgi:hypothetical protein
MIKKINLSKVRVATLSLVQDDKMMKTVWNARAAFVLAVMTIVLPACTTNRPEATIPETQQNVPAEQVAEETNELIGQTVTVRSEVVRSLGSNAFTINDQQFLNQEGILVVNATGQPLPVLPDEDTKLQVTGEVRQFVLADVEREFDLDLQPDLYTEYERRPAIVARSIALAPEPGDVTRNPSLYYGKLIAVEAEVEELVSPIAFTLDEDQLASTQDLLVLNATPSQAVGDDERVVVTGVLRPFVLSEFERDYDLNWDLTLQRQLEAEYTQKPALVAKSVYPSAVDN